MAKLVSGKVKKTPPTQVSADRYNFISLDQVEPDLGVPDTSGKVLSSTTAGVRSWINPTSLTVVSPITNAGNASIGQYILGIDQTLLQITTSQVTGLNTALATKANLSGAAFTGGITGTTASFSGDLSVSGNFTVSGTQTIINTTNLAVNDSVIYLSQNQYALDAVDIGFYGAYGTTGGTISNHKHTGLVRNHINGTWYLFSNGVEPADQTVDLSSVNYDTLKLGSVVINGGLSTQFLKADGSLDSSSYLTTSTAASTFSPINNPTFTGTLTAPIIKDSGLTTSGYVTNTSNGTLGTVATIPNTGLTNSAITIGTTPISLGNSSTFLSGLTSVTATTFTGALTGNASTATTLATPRAINGVNFDGSAAITVKSSTTYTLGLTNSNLTFSSGTTWDGGTSSITLGLNPLLSNITSINGTSIPTSGTLLTSDLLSTDNTWTNIQRFYPVNITSSAVNVYGKVLTATVVSATANTNDTTFSTGSVAHSFSVGQFVTFPTGGGGVYGLQTGFGAPLPIISVTTYTFTVGLRSYFSYSGSTITASVYQNNSIFNVIDASGNTAVAATSDGTLTITNKNRPDLSALNVVSNTAISPNAFAITNISSATGTGYWRITAPGHNIVQGQYITIDGVTPSSFNGKYLVGAVNSVTNIITIYYVSNFTYVSGGTVTVVPTAVSIRSNTGSSFSISTTGGISPFTVDSAVNSLTSLAVYESGTPLQRPAQIWYDYSSKSIGGVSSIYGNYLGEYSSTATPTNYWRISDGLTINGTNVINGFGNVTGPVTPSNTNITVAYATTGPLSATYFTGGGTATNVSGTSGTNQITVTYTGVVPIVGQTVTGTGIPSGTTVTAVSGSSPYAVTLSSSLTAAASGSYVFSDANGGTGVGSYFYTSTGTVIDGKSFSSTDVTNGTRVLIKDQADPKQNGIYYCSGFTGNLYFTRATDANNSTFGQLFTNKRVQVTNGTVNTGTSWVLSSSGTATNTVVKINTDSIAFTPTTTPSTTTPTVDGTAAVGTSISYARADHVHPTDTTRAPLASPALTGTPTVPTATADTNTTQAASTAFVLGQAGTATPNMDGTASVGTSTRFARQDHTHPTDTSRLSATATAGGDLTGNYPNPTLATVGTAGTYTKVTTDSKGRVTSGTTLLASDIPNIAESQVTNLTSDLALKAPLASPTFTGTVNAADMNVSGTLTVGTYNIITSTNLSVSDSVIYLSNNQYSTDALDIGFYGAYGTTGGDVSNHKHAGLVRNHTNGVWTLFSNGVEPAGQTVDLTSVTYDTLLAGSFKINDGTSSQILAANGSTLTVDGNTITINNGVISGSPSFSLPTASTTVLGGVKIDGTTVTINGSGVISAPYTYTLPTASSTVLGGVKVGSNLVIDGSGVLSGTYSYTLPTASTTTLGGVKVDGTTITINGSGVISGANTYVLPAATASALGGIKVGTGLSVTADGTLSASTVNKYTATNPSLTPTSGVVTWTISAATHGLGTAGLFLVQVRDITTNTAAAIVVTDIVIDETTGNVTLSWNAATTVAAGKYRVMMVG
jgi:hypothetical protein